MELIKNDSQYLVSAKELYKELGMKRQYSNWIKESIQRAYLEHKKDFVTKMLKSSGGRPSIDYLLKRDSAIAIIVMSGGQFAKQVRDKVIELFKQHDTGLAQNNEQILALMDLSKSMVLVSIQKDVERKHFNLYNYPDTWWEYRSSLLGYSTTSVKEAMAKVNKKYKSIRRSLIKLDANELIRTGVIDFMKAMGKTDEYAVNVGNLCKNMAEKMELGNQIWDDTKSNPLKLNKNLVSERKGLFENVKALN